MPARVPQADSLHGDLHHLPLPDDHVDLVVCALALTHLPELAPAIAEFARVLRPGGHLVISDVHHVRVEFGSVPRVRGPAGEPGLLAAHRHLASDYLTAALPLGLQVRRCVEPFIPVGDGSAHDRRQIRMWVLARLTGYVVRDHFRARTANTVGVGLPPSANRSSDRPAVRNPCSNSGSGQWVAPTLSRTPSSVQDAVVQWPSR